MPNSCARQGVVGACVSLPCVLLPHQPASVPLQTLHPGKSQPKSSGKNLTDSG